MKKIVKWLLSSIFIFLFGCNDWLDVQPKADVTQKVIFSTPDGFESALAGIYTSLVEPSLYSNDLTMGKMDMLGQYYTADYDIGSNYKEIRDLNYESAGLIAFFKEVWSGLYKIIANCNVLIEELEKRGEKLLTPRRYHIIKGEAYALRAFLHLELDRMFTARYVNGSEHAIPYMEKFDMFLPEHLAQKEVIERVIQDLQTGITALRAGNDPVCSGNFGIEMDEFENFDYFLSNRKERLNYYAAYALLARAYMWKGDYKNALIAVDTVLNTDYYPKDPTAENTFVSGDLLISDEIMFWLRDDKTDETYKRYGEVVQENYSAFLSLESIETYFLDIGDYRKVHGIKANNSKLLPSSIKYKSKSDDDNENYLVHRLPVIRKAELLYYKAEILFDENPQQAMELMNDFQRTRGIATEIIGIVKKEDFMRLITYDARREFIGEGQFFLFNKRLNQNLYYGKKEVNMSEAWVFPKPKEELEFTK